MNIEYVQQGSPWVLRLPVEIWWGICGQLDIEDIMALLETCHYMRNTLTGPYFIHFWDSMYERMLPRRVGPQSIHRQDLLGGTLIHRFAVRDKVKICSLTAHYYFDSLIVNRPKKLPNNIRKWCIQHGKHKWKKREASRTKTRNSYHDRLGEHLNLCNKIREKPWLLTELKRMYQAAEETAGAQQRYKKAKIKWKKYFDDVSRL